jgi:predicted phosphodiesterase
MANPRRVFRCIRKAVLQEFTPEGLNKNGKRFAALSQPLIRDRYWKVLQRKGWSWGKFSLRLIAEHRVGVFDDSNWRVVVGHFPAVSISDVHLGYHKFDQNDKGRFERFLDIQMKEKIGDLIIVGDLLDLWRAEFEEIVLKYKSIFEKLRIVGASGIRILYILGNHDYEVIKHKEYFRDFPNLEIIETGISYCRLDATGNKEVLWTIYHGHQMDIRLRYFEKLYPLIGWVYRRIYKFMRRLGFI